MNNSVVIVVSDDHTTAHKDPWTIVINIKCIATIEDFENNLAEITLYDERVFYAPEGFDHLCTRLGIDLDDDGEDDDDSEDEDSPKNPDDDIGSLTIKELETICDGV